MYLAEIHGKFTPHEERKEDILTSNVFSFFKYAKRKVFLSKLLSLLGLNIDESDIEDAEFIFWPTYEDGTEPDLVIIVGEYYLLFEAKLFSGFGKDSDSIESQLVREIKGGNTEARNRNKKFQLVAVTAHYAKHQFLAKNPEFINSDILWLNWHQIALLIYKVLDEKEPLDIETRCFAEDLYSLLVKKNLRKFAGSEILAALQTLDQSPPRIFFDPTTAQYRGDFLGFINSLGQFPQIHVAGDSIFLQRSISLFNFNSDEMLVNTPQTLFFKR
jgi:hypothetical protein